MIGGSNIRNVTGLSSLERMIDVRCHGTVSVRAMSRARVRVRVRVGFKFMSPRPLPLKSVDNRLHKCMAKRNE
jgi:hypothetical protein